MDLSESFMNQESDFKGKNYLQFMDKIENSGHSEMW